MLSRVGIKLEDDACKLCLDAADSGVEVPPFHPMCRCAIERMEPTGLVSEMSQTGVLAFSQRLSPEELEMIRAAWKQKYEGASVGYFPPSVKFNGILAALPSSESPKPSKPPGRKSKSTKVKRRIVLE